jgi:hypothetical protein
VPRSLPFLVAAALLCLTGCDRGAAPAGPVTSATPAPRPSLPHGMPPTYTPDVAPGDVPVQDLVPHGATVTGSWYPITRAGGDILVAYADPSTDPFRAERGLALWRRFPDAPAWRAVTAIDHPADRGVLSIQASTDADVTGDGSVDALVFESTGGSGDCGTWRVIDLAAARPVFARPLCDAQIAVSASPVGLTLTRAVFKPGDSHCCPSALRTSVLTYQGDGRWTEASSRTTPTG